MHVFRSLEAAMRFRDEFRRNAVGIVEVHPGAPGRFDSYMEWTTRTRLDTSGDVIAQMNSVRSDAQSYWRASDPRGLGTSEPLYDETLLEQPARTGDFVVRF